MNRIDTKIIHHKGECRVFDGKIFFPVSTKTNTSVFAVVDLEDWMKIRRFRWSAMRIQKQLYVRTTIDGQQVLLHRFLMEPENGFVVDHINGEPLDNTRDNLRICTQQENIRFGQIRRVGFINRPKQVVKVPTVEHRVKRKLADGTIKEYVYKTRSKKGIKSVCV